MYEPPCAVCGHPVAPDQSHVKLGAETIRFDDRNALNNYYLHPDCWRNTTGSWRQP